MRNLFTIPIVLITLSPSSVFGIEYTPKLEVDLVCHEITAKAYYADGALDNVKLDGEPIYVEIRPKYLSTKFSWASSANKYDYVSGFYNKAIDYFNMSFVSKYGGTWGTRMVTFMFDGKSQNSWLIQTEPMVERGRALVRTHYHRCK